MNTRPFDWRDLPTLHRFRDQCLFLDTQLVLTNGPIFAPTGALLSFLSPKMSVFTSVYVSSDRKTLALFGQVTHYPGASSAHISFLTPSSSVNGTGLPELVEQMVIQVGERGALHLLAEADEQTEIFELLRQIGFGVYARQQIWKLSDQPAARTSLGFRRATNSRDLAGVKFLYANLVPGLVQQVEPSPANQMRGLVYYRGNELLAFVELRYGRRGIWVQPFIHPDAENVVDPIFSFLKDLPYRRSRPVYICVRSYQAWLESALEKTGAQPGLSQGVMVRHLARRITQTYGSLAVEAASKEPSIPVAH
jgi:hypothetical protein